MICVDGRVCVGVGGGGKLEVKNTRVCRGI